MVEAEVVVDVCRCHLAGVDGADDGGGAGLAVAAREQAVEAGHGAVGGRLDLPPLAGDAHRLEGRGVDVLANGHEHAVALDDVLGLICRAGCGAPAARAADDLRLHAHAVHAAVLAHLDAHGRRELKDLATLGLGAGNLGILGRHVRGAAAVDDRDLLRPQAHTRARHVHGHVAAADDHHALAREIRGLLVADGTEHPDGALHAGRALVLQAELLVVVGADGEVDRVVLPAQALESGPVHAAFELDVDAAVQDPVDLLLEPLARQAIAGDAVAQHAAEVLARLEHLDLVPHEGKVVGAADAGGATTDDRDALARLLGDPGTVLALHVLGCVALEREDVHRVVHHAAAAVHLAGMLAHQAADHGQRVVLADDAYGVRVAPRLDERDVAGDVHARGATADAGHELGAVEAAAVLVDVVLEVVAKAPDGHECHGARLVANGAVARQEDRLGRALDEVECRVLGAVLEHVLEQARERLEPHAAGRALATALRGAEVDEGRRELHRAGCERAHRQTPPQRIVQVVHDGLGMAALHHMQSCHGSPPSGFGRRHARDPSPIRRRPPRNAEGQLQMPTNL